MLPSFLPPPQRLALAFRIRFRIYRSYPTDTSTYPLMLVLNQDHPSRKSEVRAIILWPGSGRAEGLGGGGGGGGSVYYQAVTGEAILPSTAHGRRAPPDVRAGFAAKLPTRRILHVEDSRQFRPFFLFFLQRRKQKNALKLVKTVLRVSI